MIDKLLICTDLDRTLIPNGDAPESPQARDLFSRLVSNQNVTLAYVSGRDQVLVQDAIVSHNLPLPDFVIADVGSTIYEVKEDNQWLRLKDWDDQIAIDWQNRNYADLIPLFADLQSCRLQEKTKQGLHKLSYYVSLDADIETLISEMQSRLDSQGIQANLIWSVDEQAKVGLLDILPKSANKYKAITFLMKNQNFTLENTVFSGDSGNDLAVLVSPLKAILVANANTELKQLVKMESEKMSFRDSLYIAQGGWLNLNGNYSAGILEGVFYYFPELQHFLKI